MNPEVCLGSLSWCEPVDSCDQGLGVTRMSSPVSSPVSSREGLGLAVAFACNSSLFTWTVN